MIERKNEVIEIFNSQTSFLGPGDKEAIKEQIKVMKDLKRKAKDKRRKERLQFLNSNDIIEDGITKIGRGPFLADIGR
jgi:hypothetical protein